MNRPKDLKLKFGIVILNYLTYKDAIDIAGDFLSVKNIKEHNIYIVDNRSNNESVKVLTEQFSQTRNVSIFVSKENLGFARGNNLGIKKALADKCEMVICCNNDVRLQDKEDFFDKLENVYGKDKKIAVIGPKITTLSGKDQNPYKIEPFTKTEKLKLKLVYGNDLGRAYFWLRNYYLPKAFHLPSKRTTERVLADAKEQYAYSLHGSFLIFTPAYFKYFEGLDENTFLYYEERILSEIVLQKGLKMYYYPQLSIIHKEDSSTDEMLKKLNVPKLKFTMKHNYDSARYFVKKILK